MSDVTIKLQWNQGAIQAIENKAAKGLVDMGYDIASVARVNAPYRHGHLSNSIRVEEDAGDVLVIAGGKMGGIRGGKKGVGDIRYAAIQEFGGYAGRNHSVRITGKHYMERAMNHVMAGDYLTKYFGGIT